MQNPLGRIQYENILPVHFYDHEKESNRKEIIFVKCYKSIDGSFLVQFISKSIKIQLIAQCKIDSFLLQVAFNGLLNTKKAVAITLESH